VAQETALNDRGLVGRDFAHAGYRVIPKLLPDALREFLYEYGVKSAHAGRLDAGDKDVPNAPCRYGDPLMESLLVALLPQVSAETAMTLHPTYSYFRIYQHGDSLKMHRDRPSCEVSVTINLGYEAEAVWPLWIETDAGLIGVELDRGDGLLYKGTELVHGRRAFEGTRAAQVFLHYVSQSGPHREWIFDKRASLATSTMSERTVRTLMARAQGQR
jgi:hypothetical protein